MVKRLQNLACAGAVPGRIYTAPGSPVVAVTYNGVLLRRGIDYTLAVTTIMLNFSTETGDAINALCVA
jgi:hypothetical protein